MKIFLLLTIYFSMSIAEKANITIFYEPFSLGSVRFILNQIKPSYPSLKDKVNFDFVPFFKNKCTPINAKDSLGFECWHKIIQSSTLDRVQDDAKKLEYVACQVVIDPGARYCSTVAAGIPFENQKDYFTSDEGINSLKRMEDITERYKIKNAPAVVHNGIYDENLQLNFEQDFKNTLEKVLNSS